MTALRQCVLRRCRHRPRLGGNRRRNRSKRSGDRPAPADFDRCYCQRDLDDSNVVNCESQRFVLSDQSVKIGFFPGEMQLLAEDPPNWTALPDRAALRRSLLIAVRGDPSLTVIESARPLRRGRSGSDSPDLRLSCDMGSRLSDADVAAPYSPHHAGDSYSLSTCGDNNRVNRTPDEIPVNPDDPSLGTKPRLELPTEPMSVFVDRGCVEPGYRHDRGTFLSDKDQNPSGRPPCYKLDGARCFPVTTTNIWCRAICRQARCHRLILDRVQYRCRRRCSGCQWFVDYDDRRTNRSVCDCARKAGDLSQPWYVTSKLTSTLATFRLGVGPKVVPGLLFGLSGQFSTASQDVRSIVFERSGDRAYLALFQPPALAVVDTRLRGGGSSIPVNQSVGGGQPVRRSVSSSHRQSPALQHGSSRDDDAGVRHLLSIGPSRGNRPRYR